jgi:hypothetical protein
MHLKPPNEVSKAIDDHTKDWPPVKRLVHAANVWSAYAYALRHRVGRRQVRWQTQRPLPAPCQASRQTGKIPAHQFGAAEAANLRSISLSHEQLHISPAVVADGVRGARGHPVFISAA